MSVNPAVSITVCGDGGCGKSSITLRLVRSAWTSDYDPTIEDSYSVTRSYSGQTYHLHLTDTAGQEEYRGLFGAAALSHADAFLLVYDITNPRSLEALNHFVQLIDIESEQRMDRGAAAPVKVVVGNKCDLKSERQISSRDGIEWARNRGCMFMETSARECVNIEETFQLMVKRVVQARSVGKQNGNNGNGGGFGGFFSHHSSSQGHAAARTKPLTPLNEKGDPISPPNGWSRAALEGGREPQGKQGFWSKFKCW